MVNLFKKTIQSFHWVYFCINFYICNAWRTLSFIKIKDINKLFQLYFKWNKQFSNIQFNIINTINIYNVLCLLWIIWFKNQWINIF